jgi:putative spermidine/putrescine transport system substrate-binding protein
MAWRAQVAGILVFLLCLPASSGRADDAVQLSIVSWGGAYAMSQQRAYFDPYQKFTPEVRIQLTNAGGDAVQRLREQARSGTVSWDLVDVTAADAIRLCNEGIAMHIEHDKILAPAPDGTPASQDFGQTMVSDCMIPEIVYSTTFGYRTDKVATKPMGLCDVFDLKTFPGKRALEKRPINNLEWALVCDGVPPQNVYEVLESKDGVERALHRLNAIKDQVIWWTEGEEPAKLLDSGAVVFASAYNGRLFSLVTKPKANVAMLWDRQIFDFDGWIIPKGAPHLAAALKFVKFATDSKRLADQASYIPYGPARRSSTALVGKHAELGIEMAPYMPTAPENAKTTLIYNYDWWAAHRDRLDERFRAWLDEKAIQ